MVRWKKAGGRKGGLEDVQEGKKKKKEVKNKMARSLGGRHLVKNDKKRCADRPGEEEEEEEERER